MRIALDALPETVQAQVAGSVARVTYGPENAPTTLSVATDGESLILFPERSYKHDDLARFIGLQG